MLTASSPYGRVSHFLALAALLLCGTVAARAAGAQAPGQLQVGDRVALTIEGPLAFSDTLVVRDSSILRVPNLADISVAGVRRADIQTYLTQQIAKYVRGAVVHATALIRISVMGQVGRPGFYSMPSDILLSDVVMRAGGPTPQADLNKTVVKREGTTVLGTGSVKTALASGATLDQLAIAPGDEVVVGEKSQLDARFWLNTLYVLIPLAGLILALTRR